MWAVLNKVNWSYLSIFWLAFIVFLLMLNSKNLVIQQPKLFLHADKVAHAGLFGIWASCLSFASSQRYQNIRYIPISISIIIVAISTEFIQGMTSYRSADPLDALADIVGAGVALIIMGYFFNGKIK